MRLLIILAAGFYATTVVRAEVPSTVSYQGRLTTASGTPVADGAYSTAFRIFDDSTGGSLLWEEVKSVTIRGGLFTVQLGEVNPLNQNTLSIPNLFLAIQIGAGPESTPRTRLNAVPYATLVGTIEGASGGVVNGDIVATGQVSGSNSTGTGGYFQSSNTTTANQHGVTGKYSASYLTDGSGVYGYSKPGDNFGIGGEFEGGWSGVHGSVTASGATLLDYSGVRGLALTETPELPAELHGVFGSAIGGRDNFGVWGEASGSAISNICSYFGLYSLASGVGQKSTNYGLWAKATGGGQNIGVFAMGATYAARLAGDVDVTGTLYKTGGSFKIDHPLDPANKYLQHSFVESPDMKNIYDGTITLDAYGRATVTMPDWFDALNRDFRYQLTAIGAPGPNLFIAEKMTNNQFSIAGGSAGMEVSWQVTGVRHDAWAEAHRIQVEVPKDAGKAGTYLYPELFGMPESMGETYELIKHADDMAQHSERDRERMAAKKAPEVPKK